MWIHLRFVSRLTAWSRVLFLKSLCPQLDNAFPAVYGTRSLIPVLTTAHHVSLSWARSNLSLRRPNRFLLISINPAFSQVLQVVYILYVFLPKPYMLFSSPFIQTCYITRQSHSYSLDKTGNICWGIQIRSSSLCDLLQPAVTSSLLGPNIFPCTLFSNTLNVRFTTLSVFLTIGLIVCCGNIGET